MGIDVSQLSPWAQKQIARKLAAQNLAKQIQAEVQEEKKRSKYNNQPTERGQIKFDSKAEARRYDELMLMLKAGKIRDLRLQPQFTLQEAYTTPDGERVRAIIYRADFSYEAEECECLVGDYGKRTTKSLGWHLVVEDVKSKPTKTKVYAMKKKMLRDKFGITITEIE